MSKSQKMPIAWHEDCLKNRLNSLRDKLTQIASLQAEAAKMNADIMHLQMQLYAAKQRKLDGFDGERFMKDYEAKQRKLDGFNPERFMKGSK